MKTLIAILTASSILSASTAKAFAGDREWATAGKILTGLVIGGAVARALEPPPVYYAPTVVYSPPPPVVYQSAPVFATPPPAPVYVQPAPAPVVVYPAPVYYARPAPVYYAPVPIVRYGPPPPLVSFRIGFGHSHYYGNRWGHSHHHHRGRW